MPLTPFSCDDRAFMMSTVSSMDVNSSSVYFYPRLFPIHDLNTSEEGLPDQIRCSIDKIQENGVYLLENGIYVFMYITLAADPNWVSKHSIRESQKTWQHYFD